MRILLAAKHGKTQIGGVQSWCKTVGVELTRMGHETTYWGSCEQKPSGKFDAGIFANIAYTKSLLKACSRKLIIGHGIITDESGGEAFTSEEVRDHWKSQGFIIRQPIDLDFWSPLPAAPIYLTRFSYRGGLPSLGALAKRLNLEFRHINNSTHEESREVIRQSAIVVATGRAACEAMACGVPVLIADDRVYQGALMDEDTAGSMLRNYSGRGGVVPTAESMELAIRRKLTQPTMRHHVQEHHNATTITNQLLCSLS